MQPRLKPKIAVAGKIQFKLYPLIFVKNLSLCMGISITLVAKAAWLAGLLMSGPMHHVHRLTFRSSEQLCIS